MHTKDAYTTKEMAAHLNVDQSNIARRAEREGWQHRTRAGRGGGKEWLLASLPEATRLAVRAAVERAALAEVSTLPAVATIPTRVINPTASAAMLDDKRRYKALAKADILRLYMDWQRKHGHSRRAKQAFIAAYDGGAWPELKKEVGKTSWKSIERWKIGQAEAGSVLVLADKRGLAHRGKSLLTHDHHTLILGHILHPNQPKISQAIRQIQARCTAKGLPVPSEPTLRRFVNTYTRECFDEWTLWREGKKAWNDKCAISILRDWSLVGVGDVVIADGHTLNFETINPDTGKPCRMTLLLFFDGASSHPIGWEIMPTENTACISAALRRTCILLGKFPRVVYIDNGKAFRAKFFKGCDDFEQAGFLGLYAQLGCEVIHAWPYHGQSKPIERFFGTMHEMEVWQPSYTGNDIAHKPARMKRGEPLHNTLYAKLGGRPLTLEETHTAVSAWFDAYCARPQCTDHLKGRSPAQVFNAGRGPGLTVADIERLTLLMLQREVRTITKDGFRLHGRLYWHEAIASRRHPVLVRYDSHAPHEVKVYTLEGDFLCEARDREYYRIATGIHPAARVLGTAEQQQALEDALALKKGQERESTASLRHMCEAIVLPETRARLHAIETSAQAALPPARTTSKAPTQAEVAATEAAVAAAQNAGRAAREAAPTYTPSTQLRHRDALERYEYLFAVLHEQGIALTPDDAAWMARFEAAPEYARYQTRFASLRQVYTQWGQGKAHTG